MLDYIHMLLKIQHKNRTFYVRIVTGVGGKDEKAV